MSYTATEIVFIVTGVITVITPSILSVISAWRTSDKVDKVAETANIIHTNTNGKLTRQDNQIASLLSEVRSLTAHIARQDKDKAVAIAEKEIPADILEVVKTAVAEVIKPINGDIIIIPLDNSE